MEKRFINIVLFLVFSGIIWGQKIDTSIYHSFANEKGVDYALIDQYVKGKEVVLLGEIMHGEKEITLLKTRLVKYLIEHHGFDIIAFESSFYDFGEKSTLPYYRSIFPVWSDTYAFQEILKYLKRRKSVKVLGFDNQLSTNVQELFDQLDENTHKLKEGDDDYFFGILETAMITQSVPEHFDFARFDRILKTLERYTTAPYIKEYYDNIRSHIQFLQKYGNVTKENWKAEYSNIRDKKMADNLLFLHQHYKKHKIICWGANMHFSNQFKNFDNEELKVFKPMGAHLRKAFGKKILSIGFTAKQGAYTSSLFNDVDTIKPLPQNSVEYQINFKDKEYSKILELNKLKGSNVFVNLLEFNQAVKGDFSEVFDLVIVMDSVSPVKYGALFDKNVSTSKSSSTETAQKKKHRLIDAKTQMPIPFCNIYYAHHSVGTVSDINGYFQIEQLKDTLLFSCIGYQSKQLSYEELPDVITMESDVKTLKEVVVRAKRKTARSIMVKVIDNLPNNYNEQGYSCLFQGGKLFIENRDTIVDFEGVKTYFQRHQFNNKKSNLYQESYEKIIRSKQKEEYYPNKQSAKFALDLYLGGINLLNTDIKLFNKIKLKKYRLEVNSKESNEAEYVIDFESKRHDVNYTEQYWNKRFYGKIYIDKKTFAIKRLDYARILDVKKFNSLLIYKNTRRYSKDNSFTSIKFTKKGKYYYLSSISRRGVANYHNIKFGKDIEEKFYFKSKWIENSLNEKAEPLKTVKKLGSLL